MSDYRFAVDRLIGWAAFFHGAETLADLADIPLATLLKESGLLDIAHAIPVAQAADEVLAALEVGSAFERFFRSLDNRRQTIALRRTYAQQPEGLEQLGAEFGVSRERVRQLSARVHRAFQQHAAERFMNSAIQLRQTLPMLVPANRFEMILESLVEEASPPIRSAATIAMIRYIGYEKRGDDWVSREFRQLVATLSEHAPEFADSLGIIDEMSLRASFERPIDDFWMSLTAAAGLKRVNGQLLTRDTHEVRLVLGLEQLGMPATKEQLAELTGLEVRSLASVLSSSERFVRITKDTWGLANWTDDPYDGVVGEILQRIESGGGAASVDELLNDIPTRFDVSPGTVRAYLSTPKFLVENGLVRVADVSATEGRPRLAHLRNVIWTADGIPVLRLTVSDQHLRGFSIKVPPAVAAHLGVGPDTDIMIPVRRPEGGHSVSVIWRAHDPNGPELGRLREPLSSLGAADGTEVFIVLDPSGLTIELDASGFRPHRPNAPTEVTAESAHPSIAISHPALDRMKSRRRIY